MMPPTIDEVLHNLNQQAKFMIRQERPVGAQYIIEAMSLIRGQDADLRKLVPSERIPGRSAYRVGNTDKVRAHAKQLPVECRPHFEGLVHDYQFWCLQLHSGAFVSYAVIAKLIVEGGWRRTGEERTIDNHATQQKGL